MAADPGVEYPPWIDLPRDVTANILQRLGPEEILLGSVESVCTTWRSVVCADPSLWRVLHMRFDHKLSPPFESFYRRAVHRSQGQLIDISFKYFCTDNLLQYVSQRSTHLKILNLDSCLGISPEGLTTAVKSFPRLKELHLRFIPAICALDIKTIGASCPMLMSFTFIIKYKPIIRGNGYFKFRHVDVIDNTIALSIAKTMPNLIRLRLIGDEMGNEGLLAILDCCSKLVSLDIRMCYGVDFRYDLARRCVEKMKELKPPRGKLDDGFLNPAERIIYC